jgi:hypothetical protein
MYCPQCATENLDNASFCRGCGSNISLVPQALSGSLPAASPVEELDEDASCGLRRKRKDKGPPSIERGVKNIFSGLAFVFVALSVMLFMPGGKGWWFWMLFPAFTMLGGGMAEIVRLKLEKNTRLHAAPQPAALPSMPLRRPSALPRRNTAELIQQPPSITENTTRHLETPVENKRNGV